MQKDPDFVPFKFRDLKVYASKEWLAENKKKYRQVFDKAETTYMYAEFSFFNKLFDEQEWDFECNIKCFNTEGTEVCDMRVTRKVSPDDNIVYIREGWGMDKPGAFWKKGTYRWEVFVNAERIASKSFYVLDKGVVSAESNPFLEITSMRLYEGDFDDRPKGERIYYKSFSRDETRYVWVEFIGKNLLAGEEDVWQAELFFNFYADTGQLKGTIQELITVNPTDKEINVTVGWGSQKAGTWYKDNYKLEVVFMDQLVGVAPFSVDDEFEVAEEDSFFVPDTNFGTKPPKATDAEESKEDTIQRLEELIGLESIKKRIAEYTTYLNFLKLRIEKGIDDKTPINLHAVFTGNPGTGKTTVAKMLGKIYKDLGLLTKGHVYEVDRADLVGEYIGQTAPKVKEAIKKARGGILFIDEAYSLARKGDDTKDFGKEVIEIVLKEMSDGEGNMAIVVAGYPEEMKTFVDSNPGLKSRFTQFYEFPDYTPQELLQIADYVCKDRAVTLHAQARERLYTHIVESYRNRDRSFGNARLVNQLIDAGKMNMGLRLMTQDNLQKMSKEELSTIKKQDIEKIFEKQKGKIADIPVDDALLKISLRELQDLVGLGQVKKDVTELVQLVHFYREIGKDPRSEFSLHGIFKGNPGTGKTTVARILANIYKALGILERGHLVEVDRQKLVAGYLGQTATKTNEIIDKAKGGVLFIDEAYTLLHGDGDTFGKEAISTLLKRMEDERGQFVVIVAGYPDNMDQFLKSNPGLKSRFDRTFTFEDYSKAEMWEIMQAMLTAEGLTADKAAAEFLQSYLDQVLLHRDKFFGNGRTVRKIVEKAVKNQHLRLAQLPPEKRKPIIMRKLTLPDVKEFNTEEMMEKGSGIGFRRTQSGTE